MHSDDTFSSHHGGDDDLRWARNGLGFELGVSTWRDRVGAIVHSSGSRANAAALMGASLHDIKNWLNKARSTTTPRDPQAIADAAGISVDYVVSGVPKIPRDFEVELDRLNKLKSEFVPAGTTTARRNALRQLVDQLRAEIEARRLAATGPQHTTATRLLPRAAGLADQPDGLVLLPVMTTRLGQAALGEEPSPLALSEEWLVRQRLDATELGVLELQGALYVVDTAPRARSLADRCLYAVLETGERLAVCQWLRRPDGVGELVLVGRTTGLDPRRNPADIVGRVVYELAPR